MLIKSSLSPTHPTQTPVSHSQILPGFMLLSKTSRESVKNFEKSKGFNMYTLDLPPPSNSGKWRIIGIPY